MSGHTRQPCGECGFTHGHAYRCSRHHWRPRSDNVGAPGSLRVTRSPRRVPTRTQSDQNKALLARQGKRGIELTTRADGQTRYRYLTPEHASAASQRQHAQRQAELAERAARLAAGEQRENDQIADAERNAIERAMRAMRR